MPLFPKHSSTAPHLSPTALTAAISTCRVEDRASSCPHTAQPVPGALSPPLPHGPAPPHTPSAGYPHTSYWCSTQERLLLQHLVLSLGSHPHSEGRAGWMLPRRQCAEAAAEPHSLPAPPLQLFALGCTQLPTSTTAAIFQTAALEQDQGGFVGVGCPLHGAQGRPHWASQSNARAAEHPWVPGDSAIPMLSFPKNCLQAPSQEQHQPAASKSHLRTQLPGPGAGSPSP